MELVIITFATHDSTYRFTYVRGHHYGQLEGVVGDHGGRKATVHVEEIRDLVHEGEKPELRLVDGRSLTLKIKEIKEVSTRELHINQGHERMLVTL